MGIDSLTENVGSYFCTVPDEELVGELFWKNEAACVVLRLDVHIDCRLA
ncbi:hypothetical protein EVA_02506 [gut metagenome]|uniref:Uncharacterized protein n=1 Tax=gut metagenome TaxID=749906 RepID=J9GMV9_9ZZZZ